MTDMPSIPSALRALCAACFVTLPACTEEFAGFNEIEGLRVLGVQAQPSTLAEGETSALRALVYLEEGDRDDLRYRWSLCPLADPQDPSRCLQDMAGLSEELDLDVEALTLDLGNEATAEVAFPPGSAALLATLCKNATEAAGQLGASLFNCEGGFPMQVFLTVRHGKQEVIAVKQVRFALDEDTPKNRTPKLVDRVLIAQRKDEDDKPPRDDAKPLADGGAVTLGESYRLFLQIDEGAETFLAHDDSEDGAARERRERLYVTWFVSSGETTYVRTSQVEGVENPLPIDENNWSLPWAGDEDAGEAHLFMVLRDERGGTDWIERRVELKR